MPVRLILGGARSGKSRHAQACAEAVGARRCLIATAEALDGEMAARIERHRADRDASWTVIEEPLALPNAVERAAHDSDVVLVDCLTLWLSNLMHAGRDPEAETATLITCLTGVRKQVILVSNEVGLGLVPETPLGRAFRDAQGRLNQTVAGAATRVEFIAAGLPIALKG